MSWKVPQFNPYLDQRDEEAVAACVRSGWITEGPRCAELVEQIKALAGVRYGVLAPNGTLALFLALRALGIGPGDEVIVPDLTFVASATAVVLAGARPVFADVTEHAQLDWEAAESARTTLTRAVMPVHLYGAACAVPAQSSLAVVEDACQALGVTSYGKPCGSLGTISAFSFFADKTITTGEGGFVGTNDAVVFDRLRYLRNQGRLDRGSFVHPQIGQNFRLTDLQAALGLSQLDRLPEIVQRKQEIFRRYKERLAGVVEVLEPPPGSSHIPFRTVVLFLGLAQDAAEFLKARGIEPRSAFYPLHKQPCFAHLPAQGGPFLNAVRFWNHALCLPTFPGLTPAQQDLVCSAIEEYCSTWRAP